MVRGLENKCLAMLVFSCLKNCHYVYGWEDGCGHKGVSPHWQ